MKKYIWNHVWKDATSICIHFQLYSRGMHQKQSEEAEKKMTNGGI